jgi:hypothetical protein
MKIEQQAILSLMSYIGRDKIHFNKGDATMKTNNKGKIQTMTSEQLIKRYNYLKSKLPPKADDISNQMKYILFHARKRKIKV